MAALAINPITKFLSTLSLRRATIVYSGVIEKDVFLSTLSLRRATSETMPSIRHISYFYPRSPCGERRFGCLIMIGGFGADFYPRSPCGERRSRPRQGQDLPRISIHALLAESDERADSLAHAPPQISIHALLAESDKNTTRQTKQTRHFYPRSPCGERPVTRVARTPTTVISIHALLAESDTGQQNTI